jgi:thiol:disulfide interchange protein DsbD
MINKALKKFSYLCSLQMLTLAIALFFISNAKASLVENNSIDTVLFEKTEFLKVNEAFQLNPIIEDDQLVLNWFIAPGYYLYKNRFKLFDHNDDLIMYKPSYAAGGLIYDEYYKKNLEVYYGYTKFSVPLNISTKKIIIESQGCADAGLCYPVQRQTIFFGSSESVALLEEKFDKHQSIKKDVKFNKKTNSMEIKNLSLYVVLSFAFLGGLILNLMPCVFPILSIKILNLATLGATHNNKYLHGLAYTLGILLSFVLIGSLLMILRDTGESLGWGFQLQSPIFVGFIVYLFVLIGLSLSGWFTFGNNIMGWGQKTTQGNDLSSSFMTGLLATVVASPCTAPFMGTALGFALTQSSMIAISTFIFLGLGMAFPILAITCLPNLSNWLPKPGVWMDRFKQFLAFPLYLTAVWLIWVLGRQTNSDVVAAILCGIVFILFAIWLHKIYKNKMTKILAVMLFALAIFLPIWNEKNRDTDDLWEAYSKERLSMLLENEDSVFINLTADWCITCLVNEQMVLKTNDFSDILNKKNIIYLKADWTKYNPEITELLNDYNRSGVPLYLFYPSGEAEPIILPQILKISDMIDVFSKNIR